MYRGNRCTAAVLIAIVVILSASCGTLLTRGGGDYRDAEQAYKAGDYVSAAESALSAVQQNSDFEEAIDLLQRTFPMATAALEEDIAQLEASDREFKYESIAPLYERLKQMHDIALSLNIELQAQDYAEQYQTAKDAALEDRYQTAITLLNKGGFANARLAAEHLDVVRQQVSDYKHINYYLNQAWETSEASLYIYVADDLGNLGAQITSGLSGNRMFSENTKIVPAGTVQTSRNMSAQEVVSLANAQGVDLLLYITGETSRETQPFSVNQKEVASGVPGVELTASYRVAVNGNWQVFDVASGEIRSQDSYSTSIGEQLSVHALNPSDSRSMQRVGSLPERRVSILETGEITGGALRALVQTANFQSGSSSNPVRFQNMGFNEITSALSGIWLYNTVYFLVTSDGTELDISGNSPDITWAELDEYVGKHRQIYQLIEDKAKNHLDGYVSNAQSRLIPEAADVLIRAASGSLLM